VRFAVKNAFGWQLSHLAVEAVEANGRNSVWDSVEVNDSVVVVRARPEKEVKEMNKLDIL
jgi:hypothetical protein